LAQSLLPATLQPGEPAPDPAGWLLRDQIPTTFAGARAASPALGKIGMQLYRALAAGDLQQQLEGLAANTRLILDIRDRTLAGLPWELLARNQLRLFTDATRPISRGAQDKLKVLDAHEWPLRMLLVVGSDEAEVQASTESELIREALVQVDADVDLLVLSRPTKAALVERLQRFKPHIFHFVGHGGQIPNGGDSFLRLDSEAGSVQWTGAVILHDLQGVDTLRFVFLNACRTMADSQTNFWTLTDAFLDAGVPAVLGMHTDVTGEEAASFAGAVYRTLAAGKPLDVAVAEGRRHLINIRADALQRREWAAPALQVRCAPESVLEFGKGVEPQQRTAVHPAFAEVRRFVDRGEHRWQAWTGLQHERRRPIVVLGEQDAGKTSFAKMLMHRCALREQEVRYIDLQGSRKDFLTVLRLIRDGRGGDPELLTRPLAPLAHEAFAAFNRKVNAVLEAAIPPGGSADQDIGETILQDKHKARVPELLEAFQAALKQAAAAAPLFLVLDHLDLVTDEFNHYLRPLLLNLCQSEINLCVVVVPVPKPAQEPQYNWEPLQGHMIALRIEFFREQEWVELALEYVQRQIDPGRFADDAERRQWFANLRNFLQPAVGLFIQDRWKPNKLLSLNGLVN
jgi:hypothetical protein